MFKCFVPVKEKNLVLTFQSMWKLCHAGSCWSGIRPLSVLLLEADLVIRSRTLREEGERTRSPIKYLSGLGGNPVSPVTSLITCLAFMNTPSGQTGIHQPLLVNNCPLYLTDCIMN